MTKRANKVDDAFQLGTVWAVPLCDPQKPNPNCAYGLAVLIARREPFTARKGTLLMYGFPGGRDLSALPLHWYSRHPSTAIILFAQSIIEAKWERIGAVDVSSIPFPGFKMVGLDGTWREAIVDKKEIRSFGLANKLSDDAARNRAYAAYVDADGFQYRLFKSVLAGWEWAPPLADIKSGI